MTKLFSCHDGCLAPIIAKKNTNEKWTLYGISEVQGMGMAEYNNKVTNLEYDELLALNSFSGVSYICTSINRKWGLIEIKNDNSVQGKWSVLSDNKYNRVDDLLDDFKINKEEYRS